MQPTLLTYQLAASRIDSIRQPLRPDPQGPQDDQGSTSMTTITSTPAAALRELIAGAVIEPGDADWPAATQAFNPAFVAAAGARRDARRRGRRRGDRHVRRRARHAGRAAAHRPQRRAARRDGRRDPRPHRPAARRRDRRGAPRRARAAPAPSGRTSSRARPSSGSPRCTARRPTSASPATRSAAASAGTRASTACRPTASLAIEVVTPDGRLRRVDEEHDPELFWALRGGGGSFGIVTALEIRLYPIEEVYAGVLFFPVERAREVLRAWREWTTTAARRGHLGRAPAAAPAAPRAAAGRCAARSFAAVDAVVIGDRAHGEELLAPLRALGPEIDTFAMTAPAGIAELHMDPRAPVPYVRGRPDARRARRRGDRPLPRRGRARARARSSSSPTSATSAARCAGRAPHHGALGTFDAAYLTFGSAWRSTRRAGARTASAWR